MSERREVVVLGGGPAGSTTAAFLALAGRDVLLLDKARFPRPKPCSEYTSPAALDVLTALGARDAYLAAGPAQLLGTHVYTPSGQVLRIEYASASADTRAVAMAREKLDSLLLRHAREVGVEVREGVRGQRVRFDGSRAIGVVAGDGDGHLSDLHARMLVGADGLHSVVARDAGVRRWTPWPRRLGLVAHFEGVHHEVQVCQMHVATRGYCGLAPISDGLTSVGMALDLRRYTVPKGPRDEVFDAALAMFPSIRRQLAGARRVGRVMGVGPIARRVSRTEGDCWALVGDAAGYFDPFTGEGIYRALRGGQLLAEVAASALRFGGVSGTSPAAYGRARRHAFRHKSLVVLGIQACVSYPLLLERAARQLCDRPELRAQLSGVLGDYLDPRQALHPRFLAGTLGL
ncbi:MAG: FAD-dependent monooxygenase [Chloroflexota bacterium]|nr:FAD-dependent monooxygenase [Chloroflexota bacterium]